jgi:hypothetical protein
MRRMYCSEPLSIIPGEVTLRALRITVRDNVGASWFGIRRSADSNLLATSTMHVVYTTRV